MDWDELRGLRDTALLNMDKYQLVLSYDGLTQTKKNELATYRQELLDLPNDYDTPEEAWDNFPTKPSWMI
tara:strand:+ start:876 stop:1085 length:210 start_codon:yes stop_codon:yes gene_type:complete